MFKIGDIVSVRGLKEFPNFLVINANVTPNQESYTVRSVSNGHIYPYQTLRGYKIISSIKKQNHPRTKIFENV